MVVEVNSRKFLIINKRIGISLIILGLREIIFKFIWFVKIFVNFNGIIK